MSTATSTSNATTRPGRFVGQTIIVTGAGSGIGLATTVLIAGEGGRVVATDLAEDRLDKLRANHPDLDLVTVAGDISTQECVDAVLVAAGARVDGLVNNAGIMDGFLPAAEMDDQTWAQVLAVNLTGPMRTTRAVLPLMLAAGGGAIVNVTSEASLRTCAGAAYTASKHALNGLTTDTAFFYKGKGIRVNAVAPGGVATNIDAPFKSQLAAEVLGPVLAATATSLAQPDQLAAVIAFLLSDDASNINGVILPCDGGWASV